MALPGWLTQLCFALPPPAGLGRDATSPADQEWLQERFRVAARKRYQALLTAAELQRPSSPRRAADARGGAVDSPEAVAAYGRLEELCRAIMNELRSDDQIRDARVLPAFVNLPDITALEYVNVRRGGGWVGVWVGAGGEAWGVWLAAENRAASRWAARVDQAACKQVKKPHSPLTLHAAPSPARRAGHHQAPAQGAVAAPAARTHRGRHPPGGGGGQAAELCECPPASCCCLWLCLLGFRARGAEKRPPLWPCNPHPSPLSLTPASITRLRLTAQPQVHRHKYAEANARLNNRDIFGRFVLEWIASSSAQLSMRCRRLEQGAAGQHGWQEFASDGGWRRVLRRGDAVRGRAEPAYTPICSATHPLLHPPLHPSTHPAPTGKNKVAHLVEDMLNAVQSEMGRYQRIITYWPMYGPDLERCVTGALREATLGVSRQCGLVQIKVRGKGAGLGCRRAVRQGLASAA